MILNEPELVRSLNASTSWRLVLYTGDVSFLRTAQLFRCASVVVGVHGGGLANQLLSWGRLQVIMLEFSERPMCGVLDAFGELALRLGHMYWRIECKVAHVHGCMAGGGAQKRMQTVLCRPWHQAQFQKVISNAMSRRLSMLWWKLWLLPSGRDNIIHVNTDKEHFAHVEQYLLEGQCRCVIPQGEA